MPKALVFGEALIDEYPDRRVVAGAPLHVAAHLVSFGWEASVVSRVGDDADGFDIRSQLETSGVGTELLEVDPDLPTGTVEIVLHPNGGHSFRIRRPAAWDAIIGPPELPDHDIFYFGTLAMRDSRSRAALVRLLGMTRARRVADINLRPPYFDAPMVRFAVEHADILKAAADELPLAARLVGLNPAPDSFFALGPEWVCVTRGAQGADLYGKGGHWSVLGRPVPVTDTVGAGDAFCAGLIHGLIPRGDAQAALRWGREAALATVQQRGGFPAPGTSSG